MQTFTQALIEHVLAGRVDREVASNAATNKHDFLVSLEQAIKRQKAEQAAAEQAVPEQPLPEQPVAPLLVQPPAPPEEPGLGLRIVPAG
jgi:hypothetical protein